MDDRRVTYRAGLVEWCLVALIMLTVAAMGWSALTIHA